MTFSRTGMGPIAWVINAEIYPNWARSTGVAVATATNWAFNFLISETFLDIVVALRQYGRDILHSHTQSLSGAFFMYAGITLIGFIIFFLTVPETKGLPIEEIEDIFRTKAERERHREQAMTAKVAPEEKLVPTFTVDVCAGY